MKLGYDPKVSERHSTFLAGHRLKFADTPTAIQAAAAEIIGAPIASSADQHGGMSATPAAVLTGENGRRLFVKVCSSMHNERTWDLYRAEAELAESLPRISSIPALVAVREVPYQDQDWLMLAYEVAPGQCPLTPWRDDDLVRVLDQWLPTRDAIAEIPAPPQTLAPMLHDWEDIAADPNDPWHPWAPVWQPRVATVREHLEHDGVPSHTDLRSDNIVIATDGQVSFVDWAHLQLLPRWVDPAMLRVEVVASHDGAEIPQWAMSHPTLADAPADGVAGLIAGIAGFMHRRQHLPNDDMPWNPRWKQALARALEPFIARCQ